MTIEELKAKWAEAVDRNRYKSSDLGGHDSVSASYAEEWIEQAIDEAWDAAAPRWIPVGERLPEPRKVVDAVISTPAGRHTSRAFRQRVGGDWAYPDGSPVSRAAAVVTHWQDLQPLPPLPEGK